MKQNRHGCLIREHVVGPRPCKSSSSPSNVVFHSADMLCRLNCQPGKPIVQTCLMHNRGKSHSLPRGSTFDLNLPSGGVIGPQADRSAVIVEPLTARRNVVLVIEMRCNHRYCLSPRGGEPLRSRLPDLVEELLEHSIRTPSLCRSVRALALLKGRQFLSAFVNDIVIRFGPRVLK